MLNDFFAALLGTAIVCSVPAFAQTDTAFTYQGELMESGNAASGSYSMDFLLYDGLSGGSQVGSTVTIAAQSVSDGVFSSQLDFGPQDFSGTQYWLEIVVDGTTLSPRQPMTASPFSIQTRGLFVDENNNVGIGVTDPLYPIHVETAGIRAIFGESTTPTGFAAGVYGQSASTSGQGLYGVATATSGDTNGVQGFNQSTSGRGVFGRAGAASGDTYGVFGVSDSTSGRGIFGVALAASGNTVGVQGESDSTSGQGVVGIVTASTGTTYGVRGETRSSSGYAGYFEGGRNYFEGRVGIGRTTPEANLHIDSTTGGDILRVQKDNATKLLINANGGVSMGTYSPSVPNGDTLVAGNLTVGTNSPSTIFKLNVGGTAGKAGGGSWAVFSDKRLKKNITSMTGSLDMISALRPVNFEYTAKDHFSYTPGVQSGFIAQEVQKVIPQWVNTADDGYFYLDQVGYEALIVDAIQELRDEKDAEIAKKDQEIQQLQARLDRLERMMVLIVDK